MTYSYKRVPLKKIIKLSNKNKKNKECHPIKKNIKNYMKSNKKLYKTKKNKLYRNLKKMSVNSKWFHRVKKKILNTYQKK